MDARRAAVAATALFALARAVRAVLARKSISCGVLFRRLKGDGEIPRLLEHLNAVFPLTGSAYFRHNFNHDPAGMDPQRVFLAMAHPPGEIAASARWVPRDVHVAIGRRRVRSAGIADVATLARHRKRGLATRLLSAIGASARDAGADISSLHSSRYACFYERLGWWRATTRWLRCRLDAKAKAGYARRVSEGCPWRKMSLIYDAYNANMNGPHVRSKRYWREWVVTALERKRDWMLFFVETPNNSITAYAFVSSKKTTNEALPVLSVEEFAYTGGAASDGGRSALASLLAAARAELGVPEISLDCVVPAGIVDRFESGADPFLLKRLGEYRVDNGYMYRALNLRGKSAVDELVRDQSHTFWPIDKF